ncbi:IS30 family transposase [Aerococcaceae bacterium zg-ZJ1578]|nr:IS30 family transposase [Aerococcaceae bacterium zg-1578]
MKNTSQNVMIIVDENLSKGRFKMHSHYNTPLPTFKVKHSHLTLTDRRHIERWHQQGFSNRKIAQLLNKAPQTIHNEIKRGMVRQQVRKGVFVMVYRADFAHQRYLENRRNCVRPRKLDAKTKETLVYFMTTMKYSPEMIVGRKIVNVSVSTIYPEFHTILILNDGIKDGVMV